MRMKMRVARVAGDWWTHSDALGVGHAGVGVAEVLGLAALLGVAIVTGHAKAALLHPARPVRHIRAVRVLPAPLLVARGRDCRTNSRLHGKG